MEITERDTGKYKKRLYIHLSEADVENEIKIAHYMMAYQRNIRCTEDTDVKEELLKVMDFGEYMMVLKDTIMERLTPFALSEKKLCVIGRPSNASDFPVVMGKDFTYYAICTVKPEFELRSYEPVEVTMPELKVSDTEVQGAMAAFAERCAQMVGDSARKKVISGDNLEIKIKTECQGKPVRNLSSDKKPYVTGQDVMPEEFDKNIIGMLVGETKKFDFTAPAPVPDKDGKQHDAVYTCTVTVLNICKKIVPAITDKWVKENVSDCENVEDLQNRMRDELIKQRSPQYEDQVAGACASEIGQRLDGKIPDDIYETAYTETLANFDAQLAAQGSNRTDFLKNNNMDEQNFQMTLMWQTREQLLQGLALDAWARHFELEPEEEDYQMVYKTMAPGQEEVFMREMKAQGNQYLLDETAIRFRANRHVVDTARISIA